MFLLESSSRRGIWTCLYLALTADVAVGERAARRSRVPAFLQDDDDGDDDDPSGGLLAGMKKRTHKQYDERMDVDDAEGMDTDVPPEHLGDIKADSISAWIAIDSVHKASEKHGGAA